MEVRCCRKIITRVIVGRDDKISINNELSNKTRPYTIHQLN